jgi:hypothetical protein
MQGWLEVFGVGGMEESAGVTNGLEHEEFFKFKMLLRTEAATLI